MFSPYDRRLSKIRETTASATYAVNIQDAKRNNMENPTKKQKANIQYNMNLSNNDGTTEGPILAVQYGADLDGDGNIEDDILEDRDGVAGINLLDNEQNYFYFSWINIHMDNFLSFLERFSISSYSIRKSTTNRYQYI